MAFKIRINLSFIEIFYNVISSTLLIIRILLLVPYLLEKCRKWKDKILLNIFYTSLMCIVSLSFILFYIRIIWHQMIYTKYRVIKWKTNFILIYTLIVSLIWNILLYLRRIKSTILNIKAIGNGAKTLSTSGRNLGIDVLFFVQSVRGVIRGSELLVQGLYGFLYLTPRGLKHLHNGVTSIIGGITGIIHGVNQVTNGIGVFINNTRQFTTITKNIKHNDHMGTVLSVANNTTSNSKWRLINLPEELQELILSYLDVESLLIIRRTCKSFYHLLNTERVWRLVLQRKIGTKYLIKCGLTNDIRLEWQWACLLVKHQPLGRNLLCQPQVLSNWRILLGAGDGWRLETLPCGTDPIPEETGVTSCFATSHLTCSKEQSVDLWYNGLAPDFLDQLQPKIEFGEWFSGRYAAGCVYELKAQLLDKNKKKLTELGCREMANETSGTAWKKICFVFKDYGQGVRYINFYHGGRDMKFSRGYYGAKMAGAYVIITL